MKQLAILLVICNVVLLPQLTTASALTIPPALMLSPSFRNMQDTRITTAATGEQIVLAVTLQHLNSNKEQPFVAFLEVRDSGDTTVFLAWQSGKIAPNANYTMSASWVPEKEGNYSIRSFAVSALPPDEVITLSSVYQTGPLSVK